MSQDTKPAPREGLLLPILLPVGIFGVIALILLAFTAIEVTLWYVKEDLGGWYLPLLFTLMFSKFTLVVLWFMHLKFDDRRFARFFVMGLAGAATLFLVVLISLRFFLR